MRNTLPPELHALAVIDRTAVVLGFQFHQESMRTSRVLVVIRLTRRQMDATSLRAVPAISSGGWFALQSKHPDLELASVTPVMMRRKSWRVLHVIKSGQVCRSAGRSQRLHP